MQFFSDVNFAIVPTFEFSLTVSIIGSRKKRNEQELPNCAAVTLIFVTLATTFPLSVATFATSAIAAAYCVYPQTTD
ncbi:hypothetical protein [Nostoc sp. DedQUE09]|uniref:hypothetical protein n=1 Tax=Nostoc sp. DedQUE09 TaxID=3075394 RepID=UPI002AD2E5C5|nr:hypothetical protein [Nostoc sp. DedQUE09]MDZ7954665.1 hypothetical protein [Nostoc sp. DedQUE09]